MIPALLASSLVVLAPVLATDTPLRLAASPDAQTVTWMLDGRPVGTTEPGHALTRPATAGPHTVTATSDAGPGWLALARPEPAVVAGAGGDPRDGVNPGPPRGAGAAWVTSWTGTATEVEPPAAVAGSGLGPPALLAAVALAVLASQAKRR